MNGVFPNNYVKTYLAQNVATNAETLTIPNITEYQFIEILYYRGGGIRNTAFVSTYEFSQTQYVELTHVDINGVQRWLSVAYLTPTNINVTCSDNNVGNTCTIIGYKI